MPYSGVLHEEAVPVGTGMLNRPHDGNVFTETCAMRSMTASMRFGEKVVRASACSPMPQTSYFSTSSALKICLTPRFMTTSNLGGDCNRRCDHRQASGGLLRRPVFRSRLMRYLHGQRGGSNK